jgi:outer membrane immunogenic protein
MRILISILVLLLPVGAVTSVAAAAQGVSRAEAAFTYDWVHTNAPPSGCGCFSMNGGSGSFALRLAPSFSAVGEVGATTNGNVNSTGDGLTLIDFLGGGRYMPHFRSRLMPFGQVLVGGAHASGSLSPGQLGIGSATVFALDAGGGLDVKLSHRFAIRVFQTGYLLTMFPNKGNDRQNNLRVSGGFVIHFGR